MRFYLGLNAPRAACFALVAGVVMGIALPTWAADSTCIVAGRVNDAQQWAPRSPGLTLLDAKGTRVHSASPAALAQVTQVKVAQTALLSSCDGKAALAEGGEAQAKSAVPAVKSGPQALNVVAVNFPKLRVGGELVELQLEVPSERRIQVTR